MFSTPIGRASLSCTRCTLAARMFKLSVVKAIGSRSLACSGALPARRGARAKHA